MKKAQNALSKDAELTRNKAKAAKKDAQKVEAYAQQLQNIADQLSQKAEEAKCCYADFCDELKRV